MSYQNNNRNQYSRSDQTPEYGRRYRDGGNGYDDSFDVDGYVDRPRQRQQDPYASQQGYDNRSGRQYQQNYDRRGGQQYQQSYDGYRQDYDYDNRASRQQYRQDYDAYPQDNYGRSNRQYPPTRGEYYGNDGYDARYDSRYDNRRSRESYNDSYDSGSGYGRRSRGGYDNRGASRNTSRNASRGASQNPRGKKKKKRTSTGVVVVRVIAIIVLLAGLGIVGYKLYEYYDAQKGHNQLAALSENLDELYAQNNDFFGWLKIDDTVINYPVMYTPDDPEKYLHMDFNQDYSESGELFMDYRSDPDGYHYLIYGHHMFNGSMFGSLPKYEDDDYFNEHRTFRFDTRSERAEYEIFAVFYSKIYADDEDGFRYYELANLNDEDTYNYYVQSAISASIYNTGIVPEYGDRIVTLSTCNYHTDDGRFVVCARKKQ